MLVRVRHASINKVISSRKKTTTKYSKTFWNELFCALFTNCCAAHQIENGSILNLQVMPQAFPSGRILNCILKMTFAENCFFGSTGIEQLKMQSTESHIILVAPQMGIIC